MTTPSKHRVVLDLDRDQLKYLMAAIEIRMGSELPLFNSPRTLSTLREAVRLAGELDCDSEDGAYNILKLAPVYRELLRFGASESEQIASSWTAESDEEMVDAEQAAIAAICCR